MADKARIAELQYSPEYGRLEMTVPHGSTYEEFAGLSQKLLEPNLVKKLGGACPRCLSGLSLIIREQLEHVIHVDLDTGKTVGGGGGRGR
jgi:hypothetical protein